MQKKSSATMCYELIALRITGSGITGSGLAL